MDMSLMFAADVGQSDFVYSLSFWEGIGNSIISYMPTLLFACILFVAGFLLTKLVVSLMKKGTKNKIIDKTVSNFFVSLIRIILYTLVITIVLAVLGVPMSSIIAVIGTAGVAVGLALQDVLSNIAGGFNILLSKPFRLNDYIKTDDVEGTVEVINLWYTRIKTIDNRVVFIPNGSLTKRNLINYTYKTERIIDFTFNISYAADYHKAEKILKKLCKEHKKILQDESHTPLIKIRSHSSSSIEILCRPWVKTEDYWEVYWDMNELVKDAFDAADIEIPFPQLDVHMK